MLSTVLLILHILTGLALIAIILLQQGQGATAGAAFGSGASSTVFGARGSASFLTRLTAVLALVFFGNCLLLAYLSRDAAVPSSAIDSFVPATQQAPPLNEEPNPVSNSESITPPIDTREVPTAPRSEPKSDMPNIPVE